MNRLIIILSVFIATNVSAQIKVSNLNDFKKNKSMTYDNESSFLFFYKDLEVVFDNMTEKKILQKETKNLEIEKENQDRLAYLQENFPYPYSVIYPKLFDAELDSMESRYLIVIKTSESNSSGSLPSYNIVVIDAWNKERRKVKMQLGYFDFNQMVTSLKKIFLEGTESGD